MYILSDDDLTGIDTSRILVKDQDASRILVNDQDARSTKYKIQVGVFFLCSNVTNCVETKIVHLFVN
jgi:hypothetical protein